MTATRGTLAYLRGPKDIELRDHPLPTPEPGGLLTTVEYANVCGSDIHTWKGRHPTRKTGMMGHEGVVRILAVGEGVQTDYTGTPVLAGDLVAPVYFKTCQTCSACREGYFHACVEGTARTVGDSAQWPHFTGTFATHYYIDPDQYFVSVPDGITPKIAATANCALSQVLYGIDEVDVKHSDTVVIQGAGGLGLFAIAVANERGATTIVIEGRDSRLETAAAFHADHVIDMTETSSVDDRVARVHEITDGRGADIAIEVAGVPAAFAEGPHYLRTRGRYLVMGCVSPGHTVEFDPALLTRRSINVVSRVRYDPWTLGRAMSFLEETSGTYPYDVLVDQTFSLFEIEHALELSERRSVGRAVLRPE